MKTKNKRKLTPEFSVEVAELIKDFKSHDTESMTVLIGCALRIAYLQGITDYIDEELTRDGF